MDIDSHRTDGMTSHRSRFIALTCAVAIFLLATTTALWISHNAETRALATQTMRSSQQINEKVSLAIGTLHSMAAAHQASPTGFEPTRFEMFAEKLVASQTALTATGRFDVLPHEDLDLFTADLQLHGLFQFEPKKITADGTLEALDSKSIYSPLVAFFPQDPVSANYIGLDFSEIETTQNAITKSISRNAPVPSELPLSWFTTGHLNIFTATYFGHYVPELAEDRELQTDGGYFITLDLEEVVKQATGDSFPVSVGISVSSINKGAYLAGQTATVDTQRTATGLFPSRPIMHNLAIGAESANIVYRTPAGVMQSQLLSALTKGLFAFVLFLLGLAIANAISASRKRMLANEKELAHERERALVTLNSLQDAVITTDPDDNIDYINPAMLSILKADRKQLLGKPLQRVLEDNFTDLEQEREEIEIESNSTIASISSIKKPKDASAEIDVLDCHTSAIVDQDSNKLGAVLTMRDVSKEHALTTKLAHQATHDALTGLANRRRFESLLKSKLHGNGAKVTDCHVVGYIDLDQFKLVNDTAGHAAGDELLKKVAIDLTNLAPENIEVARLGGDEFGFISTSVTSCGTEKIAKLFHDFFQSYFYQTEDRFFSIRASIGVTTIKSYHATVNDVLSEVDIACYTAKDAGRNSYVIYDSEDLETKKREGEMLCLPALQTALNEDRFTLYVQPIVSTNSVSEDVVHHYECLLRLIGDDGSIITPYKFIVAAERYDLINDIDRWVLENAFRQITALKDTALENTIFSINLSGQSAVDPSMPDYIDEKLDEYNIKSSNICFELTETSVISNFSQAQKLIAFVRNRGCTIALDDFGAGASSFGYLKNLEVDYLKIDGQFVKEMTMNKVDFEMVRSMNAVGKALGIKTIAEFVESEEIMQALASINVDYAQGYHIGKPAPITNLINDDRFKEVA